MHPDLLTATDLSEQTAPVRYLPDPAFTLPLGDVRAARGDAVTTGLGLLGADSPLPLALADDLSAHPSDLLEDLHHQRLAALVAGLRAADLARNLDGHDPWSRRITALVGLSNLSPGTPDLSPGTPASAPNHLSPGTPDLSPGTPASAPNHLSPGPTLTALRLAPIFAARTRSLRALALALHRLRGGTGPAPSLRCQLLPAPLTPQDPARLARLGAPAARLGDSAALGAAIRLPSAAARLHLGDIPADTPGLPAVLAAFFPEPIALELVTDHTPPPPILGRYRL